WQNDSAHDSFPSGHDEVSVVRREGHRTRNVSASEVSQIPRLKRTKLWQRPEPQHFDFHTGESLAVDFVRTTAGGGQRAVGRDRERLSTDSVGHHDDEGGIIEPPYNRRRLTRGNEEPVVARHQCPLDARHWRHLQRGAYDGLARTQVPCHSGYRATACECDQPVARGKGNCEHARREAMVEAQSGHKFKSLELPHMDGLPAGHGEPASVRSDGEAAPTARG